ncbi:MAG: Lrp/AsnC family transcriptional regulator [Armatimonadota bacterium]
MELTHEDIAAVRALDTDLPIAPRAFAAAAAAADLTEDQLLTAARRLADAGVIRRFSVVLRHVAAGARANAMVVWRVPEERWDEVGEQMARFREVSHCYRRPALPGLDYTHYTMVHGSTREECREAVERIAAATGVDDYLVLFTKRELKRSSPRYLGSPADGSGETPTERGP